MKRDTEMSSWLEKNNFGSSEEARGDVVDVTERYVTDDDSDESLGGTIRVESHGRILRVWDGAGYNAWYDRQVLSAWVAKEGKLAKWSDFEKMSEVPEAPAPKGLENL